MHERMNAAAFAVAELPWKPLRQPGARSLPASLPALARIGSVSLDLGAEIEQRPAPDFGVRIADHAAERPVALGNRLVHYDYAVRSTFPQRRRSYRLGHYCCWPRIIHRGGV